MNTINANTKIAAIIRQHPDAVEAIISINPRFEKLRNPLLRKLIAGRASIAMASKVGGCRIDDFFDKLRPLGFEIDRNILPVTEDIEAIPDFIHSIRQEQLIELDVRPVIAAGKDPLNLILEKAKGVAPGQILKILNTFAPVPLVPVLEKKGFISYIHAAEEKLVEAYFFRKTRIIEESDPSLSKVSVNQDWERLVEKFKDLLVKIDVRNLEMPQPMTTILEALEQMGSGNALFVYHKRIPVYLLPEVAERGFEYRVKEINDGEVHLLIYRP